MAEKTQGTLIRVETTRAAAKAITGITAASPPVVTATAHGYANGDIVIISGVAGMTEVNDRAFVVANQATNTFELKGVNGTGYTAYSSGGNAYKCTMALVGEATGVNGSGGGAQQIDVTNLNSKTQETLPGLPALTSLTIDITLNHTDAGQTAMRDLAEATAYKALTVTTPGGYVLAATGQTSDYGFSFDKNAAQVGSFTFAFYRKPSWFA